MTSTRKFVYATLLAVASLNFKPSFASAQEMAQGTFTLKHGVVWQNALVPAGNYRFSLESGLLRLSQIDGVRSDFLLMVHDIDETSGKGPSCLVLEKAGGASYVRVMQLSEFGLTLRFRVSSETRDKQIAETVAAGPSPAQ